MTRQSRWRRFVKWSVLLLGLAGALCLGFVGWTNLAATRAAAGKLHDVPSEVPEGGVGLVFGCDDRIAGRENRYFRYRIDAAAELWESGRLRCLIVSGDNRTQYYNEPKTMKRALVEAGVPEDRIVCDYAGRRTLDSVVRAKEIFGVEQVVFISQEFQNERAAYLARANGLEYSGFNAQDLKVRSGWKTRLREVGARVKMWLDVNVLGTRPEILGPPESLPD